MGASPHGDLTYLTADDGSMITAQKSYDPWGVIRTDSGDRGPLGYQGDPTDRVTGLVDMGARMYDPALGRFTSKDPLMGDVANPVSLNPYVYGWDDPVSNTDPTGMATARSGGGGENDIRIGDDGEPEVVKVKETEMTRRSVAQRIWQSQMELWWGNSQIPQQCLSPVPSSEMGTLLGVCKAGAPGGAAPISEGFSEHFMGPCHASPAAPGCEPDVELMKLVAIEAVLWWSGGKLTSVALRWGAARLAARAASRGAASLADEAVSVFTKSGGLQDEVIAASREIIPASKLGNPSVIKALIADGSDIAQWGKYVTPTFRSPSGPFQVHFYYNRVSGAVNYAWDYKSVFTGR